MPAKDQLTKYRQIVESVLREQAQIKPSYGEIEVYTAFDYQQDHYQLVHVGWSGTQRICGSLIHIDVINDKIWIQYDGTEIGVANQLVELGIPKQDIVLAYHAPIMRQYNGFAVA
ncbi:XisI protein [Spirulina major CS-329]|uniref:XisI protein n=1 Tax=Spirulina TaxID=1154 RepID=UPI00232DE5AA|nr:MULTISPECIES: XisI protein [Spirulina]MDB9494470.1 XisI protein [Spirulina subsalsa CS-330]MDB9503298.1 XisI protein [Spirulina major CS-329]